MEYKVITDLAFTYIGLVTTMTKHYVDQGVPLIFNSSIKVTGIETSNPVFLDIEFTQKNKTRMHKKGDVLTVHTGDIGVSAVVPESLDGSLGFATIVSRITNTDIILPEYLCAFLNYGGGKEQLYKYSRDARNNLNLTDFNKLIVPVPEIEVQRSIIDRMTRLLKLIEKRNQELLLLDELVNARFVEMFGEGLADDGKYPLIPISEIGKVVSGATPKTSIDEYWDGDNLWITPAEISDETFVVSDTVRKITDEGVKSCAVNLLPIGTVILSSRAPIGKVAIAGAPMYCNQGFKNIIPNGKIDSVYLYELLTMETEYLNSLGRGATFKEISKQIVENIRIKVPPIEIQRDFSNFVKQVDKSKSVIQKSLDETQLLFDSLMQKYFG